MANPPGMNAPPQKKGAPILMIIILLAITVAAGLLTWVLYPVEPPPAPEPIAVTPRPPVQKLVELPVEEPVPPPVEDAGADDADAEVEEAKAPPKRVGKRRIPEGTIDRRRVSAFIRAKRGQVQQCYERRLKVNHMLQGVLVPEIRIHPNGSVMAVSFAQDTLHDSTVRNCVARMIKSWRFPQPEGGQVTVSNPFRFSPKLD